jgi:hypothetical protein
VRFSHQTLEDIDRRGIPFELAKFKVLRALGYVGNGGFTIPYGHEELK